MNEVGTEDRADHDPRHSRACELAESPDGLERLRRAVRKASRAAPALTDEFESVAWVALWKAALSYRPETGKPWEEYAGVVIRNDLVNFRRTWTGYNRVSCPVVVSLEAAVRSQGGPEGEFTIGDTIPCDGPPVGSECEARDAVDRALKLMTPIQRTCARSMYLDESGDKNRAARRAGICKDTMRKQLNDGAERVRKYWGDRDE